MLLGIGKCLNDTLAEVSDETDKPQPGKLNPGQPRWTHIALRCSDISATIAWYEEFTPIELITRREDADGYGAWLGMPGETNNPFILVLAQFFEGRDPFSESPQSTLGPFAHLGMELPTRADVDAIARKGEAAGCLTMAPKMMPPPIGYITMLRDPDGNTVEFSWDQGVYATLQQKWESERD
jgi:catechol 2,3-dioxygenase-like lactoylglutathione lyase family enzyme